MSVNEQKPILVTLGPEGVKTSPIRISDGVKQKMLGVAGDGWNVVSLYVNQYPTTVHPADENYVVFYSLLHKWEVDEL